MTRTGFTVALAFFTISSAFAADSTLLALLPNDAKVVGGMNVTNTSTSPFGQFVLSQMKTDGAAFQQFVTATGFDPRTDVREVVFAGSMIASQKGSGLVAARGSFNGPQILAAGKGHGATTFLYKGIEVMRGKGNDDAVLAIFDGNVAIGGDEAMVKRAIDQRGGAVTLDARIAAKVNDVSSRFDAWIVSQAPVGTLVDAAPNPQANAALKSTALQSIEQTSGGVKFGNIVQIAAEAITRSDKDALALVDVIRFVAGLMQMQQEKNPEVAKFAPLLDSMEVKANASTVQVSMSVPQADLEQIMKSRKRVNRAAVR